MSFRRRWTREWVRADRIESGNGGPYVDARYRDWNTPETLSKLNEKDEAPDYFAGLFEKMRQIAELLIDSACSAS